MYALVFQLKNISYEVSRELNCQLLCSMGMSGDFEVALECGSGLFVSGQVFK